MTASQAVEDWRSQNQSQLHRVERAMDGVTEDALNRRPNSKTWSPAQVLDHVVLANTPYLKAIPEAISRAPGGDSEIRHSFFGKIIIKGAGPSGNLPVIPRLRARETRIPLGIVEEWRTQQVRIIELIDAARGKDLARTPVRNPFFPIFLMNLADCFEILTMHTEGHLRQIEDRLGSGS